MSGVYKAGFTIIETMLFLGITGVLVIGILAGAGATINVQRYHDSATSLESVVQGLYSSVDDVVNDRADATSCNLSGTAVTTPVGQSDCVVMGRYMTINGGTTAISTVLGYNATDIPDSSTPDTDILKGYKLSVLSSSTKKGAVDWGATIKPSYLAILILRSPSSGLSYTYTTNTASETVSDMVNGGVTKQQSVCIVPGASFNGGLALTIVSGAHSANDVQVRSNDTAETSDGVVNIAC